jgi:hypothetical protein
MRARTLGLALLLMPLGACGSAASSDGACAEGHPYCADQGQLPGGGSACEQGATECTDTGEFGSSVPTG